MLTLLSIALLFFLTAGSSSEAGGARQEEPSDSASEESPRTQESEGSQPLPPGIEPELLDEVRATREALRQAKERGDHDAEREAERKMERLLTRLLEAALSLEEMGEEIMEAYSERLLVLESMNDDERAKALRQSRSAIQEKMKQLEVPEGIASLNFAPLPDDKNGGPLLMEAFHSIQTLKTLNPEIEAFMEMSLDDMKKDPAKAKRGLEAATEVLKEIARACARDGMTFKSDYTQGFATLMPQVTALLGCSSLLGASGRASLLSGNSAQAEEFALHQLDLATVNITAPNLVEQMGNVVLFHLAIDSLGDTWSVKGPSEEVMKTVERFLDRWDPAVMLDRTIRGEACCVEVSIRKWYIPSLDETDHPRSYETLIWEDVAGLLDYYAKWRTWIRMGYREYLSASQTWWKEHRDDFLSQPIRSRLRPALDRIMVSFAESEAKIRCVRSVIAVHRHRARHGGLPESMAALVPEFLSEIPRDPFVDGALLYQNGRIYSVGRNGKDDGGANDNDSNGRDDVGFPVR